MALDSDIPAHNKRRAPALSAAASPLLGIVIGALWAAVIPDQSGSRVSFQINLLVFGLCSLVWHQTLI